MELEQHGNMVVERRLMTAQSSISLDKSLLYQNPRVVSLEDVIKGLQITTIHLFKQVTRAWTDGQIDTHTHRQTTVTFSGMHRGLKKNVCISK